MFLRYMNGGNTNIRLPHSESTNNAVLAITADTSIVFWMDMVSLFPQKTWKDRSNGLRPDLMEMISSLNPQFVRFPEGVL